MFNIGWAEFLLLVLIFFILIKPKDIPVVLKNILYVFNKIKNYISEITSEINHSIYAREFKKKNKKILKIEKEINKIKKKDFFNKK